jgi:CO/xanthine dehydrogenase Mo-binding subunit
MSAFFMGRAWTYQLGMLYMDIARSPYAYAKIKNIDISAMKVLGVVAVVTGKDLRSTTALDAHVN